MNTIKVKYSLEEITSRIPGLFPYIEFDENHVSVIHKASDSDVGCYGKIACALIMPEGVFLDVEHEEIDNEGQTVIVTQRVIDSGYSYNYKTLMLVYYKYKDTYPDSTFIQFMERGIGKFKVDANIDFKSCTLVPEYDYYANCCRLWDEYTKIGMMCAKYQQMKELTGEINCDLECLVDKYNRMGGNTMRDYYGNLANEVNDISEEYYGYVSNDFNLCFNVNITASANDLGILSTFVQFFGGKYVPALYTIDNDGIVKIVRVINPDDQARQRIQDTMTVNEKYYLDDTCTIDAVRGVDYFLPYVDEHDITHGGDFVIYNDRTYVCEKPTINGEWDSSRFTLISEKYDNQPPDYDTYYNPQTLEDDPSTVLNSSSDSQLINSSSNSQLKGFIGDIKYTDESGNVQTPDEDTDWLWYYRIGRIGFSETVTDMYNNIEIIDGYDRETNADGNHYEMHLMAYGDIITKIERDQESQIITFTYVIGAHFKAKLMHIDKDDDDNYHYYYGEYEYDPDDAHGVKYTESYEYSMDGEIYEMEDDIFEYFITHDKSEIDRNNTSFFIDCRYKKAVFNTYMHKSYADLSVNGDIVTLPYLVGDYTASSKLEKDSIVSPLTKFDYLIGVTFQPTVNSDVHVSRGNASAWERHMKLGELKTFDDLETYSNGGFFNLR